MSLPEVRAALDRLIAEPRPCTMDKAREVLRLLAAHRNALAQRADAAEELRCINAAIALVWSGAVPQAGFRPGRLEKARAMLGED
jgi:hypothetical protein